MSQHRHNLCRMMCSKPANPSNNTLRRHTLVFSMYCSIALSTYRLHPFVFSKTAQVGCSSLPPLPVSCMYDSASSEGPTWIICRTSSQFIPYQMQLLHIQYEEESSQ